MAMLTTTINVKVSWWVKPFIRTCALLDYIGCDLSIDKIKQFILNNGVKCYINGRRIR